MVKRFSRRLCPVLALDMYWYLCLLYLPPLFCEMASLVGRQKMLASFLSVSYINGIPSRLGFPSPTPFPEIKFILLFPDGSIARSLHDSLSKIDSNSLTFANWKILQEFFWIKKERRKGVTRQSLICAFFYDLLL